MTIDYQRHQDGPAARAFLAETADYYRQALGDRLGLPGEALGATAFSLVIGMVVHRILDPQAPGFSEQLQVVAALG